MIRISGAPAMLDDFVVYTFIDVLLARDLHSTADKNVVEPQDADSYLQKGVRLLSLARERFSQNVKELEFSSFEEALYGVKIKKDDYIGSITKSVIRPILRNAKSLNEDQLVKEMLDFISYDVILSEADKNVYGYSSFRYALRTDFKEDDTLLYLGIREEGWPTLNVYGLKNHTHTGRRKDLLFKSADCVADIAEVLTCLILASIVRKVFADKHSESYALATGALANSHGLRNYAKKELLGLNSYSWISVDPVKTQLSIDDIFSHPWWYASDYPSLRLMEKLGGYLELKGVKLFEEGQKPSNLRSKRTKKFNDQGFKDINDVPVIVDTRLPGRLLSIDPVGLLTYSDCEFHWFLTEKNDMFWVMPTPSAQILLENACESFFKEKMEQKKVLDTLLDLSKEHAKAYQTKKNIPLKTVSAMEQSLFNSCFGYVEYDEEVDLEKVAQVANEFLAIKKSYLPGIDSTENSIRFRKLGNHKASGLYYPSVKCLCVDFRHPSSFMHEYGHLIDYCYGNLCMRAEFTKIKSEYERLLRKAMNEDESFKNRMCGKGKYNLDYFLTPTEIFARCFEIYFSKVLKTESSLVPDSLGSEYPLNEDFQNLIKGYFNATLQGIGALKEIDSTEDVAASV